jgi:hypothetical protein
MSALAERPRERLTRPDHYCLARAFAVKPLRPRAQPYGRWGLTAKARPSKRGHHAVKCRQRPSWEGKKWKSREKPLDS